MSESQILDITSRPAGAERAGVIESLTSSERGFLEAGTLARPGPVGRAVRLILGLATAWYVFVLLFRHGPGLWASADFSDFPSHFGTYLGLATSLWLINDVVNIGWSRRWGGRPRVIAVGVAVLAAFSSLLLYGSWWGPPLGGVLYAWVLYTYAHLSASFLLAAALATPGCEMRSIPDLLGRLTGREVQEHACPGPLQPLDKWERNRPSSPGLKAVKHG